MSKKIAVVTGGARGIGLSIAKELTKTNFTVVICSRTRKDCDEALTILNHDSDRADAVICDVSKKSQCKRLIEYTIHKYGQIDTLINNAGIFGPIGSIEENNSQEWLKTIETNLMSMVYCTQLVIPFMKKQKRGKIVNLCGAAVGSKRTLPRFSSYVVSKTAVAGLTEVVAEELKDFNIQVNCVSPGAVNTQLTNYLLSHKPEQTGPEMYEQTTKQLKEGGTSPDLAAQLITFLCSEKSDHISGRILSAKWDKIEHLKSLKNIDNSLYKLRRIDNQIFK